MRAGQFWGNLTYCGAFWMSTAEYFVCNPTPGIGRMKREKVNWKRTYRLIAWYCLRPSFGHSCLDSSITFPSWRKGWMRTLFFWSEKNLVLFDVCRQAVLCSHWPSVWQPSLVRGFHVIIFCSHCAASSNIVIMTSNIITTILIISMKNGSTSPRASSNRQLLSFPCHVDQIPANSQ